MKVWVPWTGPHPVPQRLHPLLRQEEPGGALGVRAPDRGEHQEGGERGQAAVSLRGGQVPASLLQIHQQ